MRWEWENRGVHRRRGFRNSLYKKLNRTAASRVLKVENQKCRFPSKKCPKDAGRSFVGSFLSLADKVPLPEQMMINDC